ncbi:hypothetical protein P4O66_004614 [Electrophorus voltai]|uniref:C2H2-type domain-containing protein n=1 Tax=Electrophorus voltai TaxID=2609070 RepID=A0AAD8ZQ83_9TELE|nr:hypothetical protein P4O66_004614 [Electrophorus voltai]
MIRKRRTDGEYVRFKIVVLRLEQEHPREHKEKTTNDWKCGNCPQQALCVQGNCAKRGVEMEAEGERTRKEERRGEERRREEERRGGGERRREEERRKQRGNTCARGLNLHPRVGVDEVTPPSFQCCGRLLQLGGWSQAPVPRSAVQTPAMESSKWFRDAWVQLGLGGHHVGVQARGHCPLLPSAGLLALFGTFGPGGGSAVVLGFEMFSPDDDCTCFKMDALLFTAADVAPVVAGSINRTGAVPTFLRTPTVIQPHLDMKPFLQFPMETAPPHSVGLFHNFNTEASLPLLRHAMQPSKSCRVTVFQNVVQELSMDPVQKAVINHTFGVPLVKTKRPVISCNVCQIRFNSEVGTPLRQLRNHAYGLVRPAPGFVIVRTIPLRALAMTAGDGPRLPRPAGPRVFVSAPGARIGSQCKIPAVCWSRGHHGCRMALSQAEAHYKGNRHARRVKGIETSKSRPLESDKPPPGPMASLSPPGTLLPSGDTDSSRADETQLNRSLAAQGPMSAPATPDSPGPLMPSPASTLALPAATSIPGCGSSNPEQAGPGATAAVMGPAHRNPETEEDKAKKLLYCSLCKVAVNSLSQLEAHNKGTKHKTILEARSGLGPIKAYPRLCPKPSGEQGGGPTDPNTQERTFHCEICNVRVNSELQLKQHISSRRHRDGVAGKPNPLLSRHKKQRGADLADLTKALGAGLLPSPLAVAAAMAAAASSGPLALRAAAPAPHPHHHHHHHLLQGPPLSHAILRPAPGPIRTSHGPILFSPY